MPYKFNILYTYRSIKDLSNTIRRNLYKIKTDTDLIVGIPRSGVLAANIIALLLNRHVTDLTGFYENTKLKSGSRLFSKLSKPSDAKHVLIVDDSIHSGATLLETKKNIEKLE